MLSPVYVLFACSQADAFPLPQASDASEDSARQYALQVIGESNCRLDGGFTGWPRLKPVALEVMISWWLEVGISCVAIVG